MEHGFLRLYTLLLSLAAAIALYLVGRRLLKPPFAALLLMLYAFNPLLTYSAVQGLREELFPLLVLVTLLGLFRILKSPASLRAHAVTGPAGAAIVLTRVSGLVIFPALYAATLWATRTTTFRSWRLAAAATAAFIVPVAAMLAHAAVTKGDPFVSSTIVAKFYHNIEFAGKPGYITRAEVEKDAFAGPPVTTGEYLFKHHSFEEVVEGTASGIWRMFFGDVARTNLLRIGAGARFPNGMTSDFPGPHETMLFLLYLAGLIFCFRSTEGRLVLGALVLMQLPLAFLAGRQLLHARLMMNATPVMLLIAAIGLQGLLVLVQRLVLPSRSELPEYGRNRRKRAESA